MGLEAYFPGDSAMARCMRELDWSRTPLGDPAGWPSALRAPLDICLGANFPIAIYWGPELALLYNDAWSPILGSKHPWALGRPARAVWPEIWDTIGPQFEQVIGSGVATRSPDQLLPMHRQGFTEECWFDYTFSPIRGSDGRVAGIFNAVVETTFRHIGERRTQLLRQLVQSTAHSSDVAAACAAAAEALASDPHDLPFALIYLLDGGLLRLAGRSGLPAGHAAGPVQLALDDPAAAWPLGGVLASGQPLLVDDLEQRFAAAPLPGGPWPEPCKRALLLPFGASPAQPAQGVLVAGISPRLALDSEYRAFAERAAAALGSAVAAAQSIEHERRRAAALAELDRAKTAFFTNVSHEFRTPLTLMLGPLEELAEGAATPAQRELAAVAQRNAERLLKLVNTLLDFARVEGGRADARFEPTELGAVTAELASNFRSACERAGLALEVDCAPLPEPVWVDRGMWEKVVLNLLSNAFKFTLEGGIAVRLRASGDGVLLQVKDSGSGIPRDELPRLFQRFQRLQGSRGRSFEGSGIGLSLVAELVRLHGGRIEAHSEPGRGSTFSVWLPRGHAHLPPESVVPAAPRAERSSQVAAFVGEALQWLPPGAAPGAGDDDAGVTAPADAPRVLIADDNADLRGYLKRLLAAHYVVDEAVDGIDAWQRLLRAPPALMVADVMMPRLDGFGLVERLRAEPSLRTLPVILLSARAGEEARVEGLSAGADDYLVKPFSARELLARVAAHLSAARMRREAGAQAAALLEQGLVGVAQTDLDGTFVEVNAHFASFVGRAPDELRTLTLFDITHPDHLAQSRQRFGELLAGVVGSFVIEKRYRRPDATAVWARSHVSLLRDADGTPRRAVAMVLDITERKRDEAELTELQRRTQRDLDAMSRLRSVGALCARRDATQDTCLRAVLDAALAISGAQRGNVQLAEPARPVLRIAVQHGFEEPFLTCFETVDTASASACGAALRDGERCVIRDVATSPVFAGKPELQVLLDAGVAAVTSLPMNAADGTPLGVLSVHFEQPHEPDARTLGLLELLARQAADTLERRQADEQVRRSEALLSAVMQQLPAGLGVTDREGRFVLSNGILDEIVPVAAPSVLPERRNRWRVWDAAGRPVPPQDWPTQRALRGEAEPGIEALYTDDAGRQRWLRVSTAPLRNESGEIVGSVCVVFEITDRKAAEAALRDADRRKDEFLATLAHELRNPLAPIRNSLQLLRLAGADASRQAPVLAMMERQVAHIVRLVDDLMEVSRITRGKIALRLQRLDLAAVLRSAVDAVAPRLDAARHAFELRLPPAALWVDADAVRLTQVFVNLLDNAVKYSDPGGGIVLAAARDGHHALVSLRDQGAGIPADMLSRVFELFTQVDRTLQRAQGGLGIGLALVRNLVELHGGSVEARSEGPGLGSEFVVRLPLADAADGERTADADRAADTGAGGRRLDGQRILVVDDNRDAADSLAAMLAQLGAAVRAVYDGMSALEAMLEHRPQVVLLDLGMPGVDGYAVAAHLRRQPQHQALQLVALTGWGQDDDLRRTRALGFDEHLVKPVEPQRVIELLLALQARRDEG